MSERVDLDVLADQCRRLVHGGVTPEVADALFQLAQDLEAERLGGTPSRQTQH